ncbi:MAG: COX15/CtaA family protein [Kiloniellales bacterium]
MRQRSHDAPRGRAEARAVGLWLAACCAMIFVMVVLGGITRLTESGLSMVEWRPLIGAIPPLGEQEWQRTFELYRQTPEYRTINRGMSLTEFKTIFWWEYLHRLWGRLIAVIFAVPFLWFLWRRRLPAGAVPKLAVMFVLGALQGLMGWALVQSGLADRPEVSHYRLTAHLGFAVAILGYILWVALGYLRGPTAASTPPARPGLRRFAGGLTGLTFLTLLSGGLVAGLDAGLTYNSFPLMDGRLVPEGLMVLQPAWRNPFDNPAMVQFDHRVLALLTAGLVAVFWLRVQAAAVPPGARLAVHAFMAMALVQVAVGVATLLMAVPIPLAVLHQAGAVALFALALWTRFEMRASARRG